MESSTWGRSVQLADRLGRGIHSEAEVRGDDGDLQLEQWHQSNLGNVTYLVIFAIISLVSMLAFVPVWVLLQAQRGAERLGSSYSRFSTARGWRN